MGGRQPESHVFLDSGTRLFEIAVLRRNGPDLITEIYPYTPPNNLVQR